MHNQVGAGHAGSGRASPLSGAAFCTSRVPCGRVPEGDSAHLSTIAGRGHAGLGGTESAAQEGTASGLQSPVLASQDQGSLNLAPALPHFSSPSSPMASRDAPNQGPFPAETITVHQDGVEEGAEDKVEPDQGPGSTAAGALPPHEVAPTKSLQAFRAVVDKLPDLSFMLAKTLQRPHREPS